MRRRGAQEMRRQADERARLDAWTDLCERAGYVQCPARSPRIGVRCDLTAGHAGPHHQEDGNSAVDWPNEEAPDA